MDGERRHALRESGLSRRRAVEGAWQPTSTPLLLGAGADGLSATTVAPGLLCLTRGAEERSVELSWRLPHLRAVLSPAEALPPAVLQGQRAGSAREGQVSRSPSRDPS